MIMLIIVMMITISCMRCAVKMTHDSNEDDLLHKMFSGDDDNDEEEENFLDDIHEIYAIKRSVVIMICQWICINNTNQQSLQEKTFLEYMELFLYVCDGM